MPGFCSTRDGRSPTVRGSAASATISGSATLPDEVPDQADKPESELKLFCGQIDGRLTLIGFTASNGGHRLSLEQRFEAAPNRLPCIPRRLAGGKMGIVSLWLARRGVLVPARGLDGTRTARAALNTAV